MTHAEPVFANDEQQQSAPRPTVPIVSIVAQLVQGRATELRAFHELLADLDAALKSQKGSTNRLAAVHLRARELQGAWKRRVEREDTVVFPYLLRLDGARNADDLCTDYELSSIRPLIDNMTIDRGEIEALALALEQAADAPVTPTDELIRRKTAILITLIRAHLALEHGIAFPAAVGCETYLWNRT